jgi:galactonate dehydratase
VERAAERFASLRAAAGPEVDIAVDFHGAVSPQTSKLLIKALEPYQPMFIEEPVQCQNVDVLADLARGTHLPIATGERIFTKWGFREILESADPFAARLCHVEASTRCTSSPAWRNILRRRRPAQPAGTHLAGSHIQLDATIPNFIIEHVSAKIEIHSYQRWLWSCRPFG